MSKSLDDFFGESDEQQQSSKGKKKERLPTKEPSNSSESSRPSDDASEKPLVFHEKTVTKVSDQEKEKEEELQGKKTPGQHVSTARRRSLEEPSVLVGSPEQIEEKSKSEPISLSESSTSGVSPSGKILSFVNIRYGRPSRPIRLSPINLLELVETIRKIPGYTNRLAYVKEHILPENPRITKEELSVLLAITIGEAAVLLSDAREKR